MLFVDLWEILRKFTQKTWTQSAQLLKFFSARRLPDRRFYRWVKCLKCGLYRSDPVLNINLSDLYTKSTFDYGAEVNGLKKTYSLLVKKALLPGKPKGGILEIGGGNGFFLEKAL